MQNPDRMQIRSGFFVYRYDALGIIPKIRIKFATFADIRSKRP